MFSAANGCGYKWYEQSEKVQIDGSQGLRWVQKMPLEKKIGLAGNEKKHSGTLSCMKKCECLFRAVYQSERLIERESKSDNIKYQDS